MLLRFDNLSLILGSIAKIKLDKNQKNVKTYRYPMIVGGKPISKKWMTIRKIIGMIPTIRFLIVSTNFDFLLVLSNCFPSNLSRRPYSPVIKHFWKLTEKS